MPRPPDAIACARCGACCSGHLIVEAQALDVMREPRLLKADVGPARRDRPLTLAELLDDDGKLVLLACALDHPCEFLYHSFLRPGQAICRIYPTRPNTCVAFHAGSDQCTEARACWRLPPLKGAVPANGS